LINALTLSIAIEAVNKTDSIKIEIANRTYPLKVSADQVAIIEKAALVVNERLKEYEIAFGVRDLQDLLAMCALHMAAEQLGFQKNRELQEDEINKELRSITELIKAFE
jgi:cell division protein ZapA (FtsZ GTPase activity inhibitor)